MISAGLNGLTIKTHSVPMLVTLKSVMTQSLNSHVVNERKGARLRPVIVRNYDSIVPTHIHVLRSV